ncbi:hypothetical protein OAK87_01075 [bacterium]|nr:hypothetical protein [bacterium]
MLSRSNALSPRGALFRGVVGSGLVASTRSRNVVRPPDRAYPYG